MKDEDLSPEDISAIAEAMADKIERRRKMFTDSAMLELFCNALKEIGVKEVILEQCQESAYIEISGEFEGVLFKTKVTNADLVKHGL